MMDMVERVARAIRKHEIDTGASTANIGVGVYLPLARAAIEAMREPTDAMLKVGPPFPYMDEYVWKTMIDEALNER